MRAAATALITALLLAFGAPAALAASPSAKGYDETLGVIGEIETQQPTDDTSTTPTGTTPTPAPTPEPTPVQESGNLPFTGLDVGIVVLMGIALVGTGFVLRRSTRGDSL